MARCLAKIPDDRFQTVRELANALDTRLVPQAAPIAKPGQTKNKSVVLSMVLGIAVLTGAGMFTALYLIQPHRSVSKKTSVSLEDNASPLLPDPSELVATMIRNGQPSILSNSRKISDSALIGLRDRVDVKILDLPDSGISDQGLVDAGRQPLTKLNINRNPRVTDKTLENIKSTRSLEELDLGLTGVTDQGLAKISGLDRLRHLEIYNDNLSGSGLAHLTRLGNLTDLRLASNPHINDDALANLASLRNLDYLDLTQTTITGAGLKHLRKLDHLSTLLLRTTQTSDEFLSPLVNLPIATLDLNRTQVTDAGVEKLAKMTSLRELDLGFTNVTGSAIRSLSRLPQLHKLILTHTKIMDADLEKLARIKSLKFLDIGHNNQLTGKGIAALSQLPLTTLYLAGSKLADHDLPNLYGFRYLKELHLEDHSSGITEAGIRELRNHLDPNCIIRPFDSERVQLNI